MSLKSSNKVETNRYELIVEVDADTFNSAIDRAYHKQVKKMNVPGFRKGKAPKAIVEKMYGEGVFYDDAMQELYPDALDNAAKEAGVRIVNDKMDLDVESVGKDGFTFKAVVTVEPEVNIENYEGIKVTPKSTEVTEDVLNEEIEKIRDRNSRLVAVEDRAVQDGDIAVIDFEGFVDGEAFDGGKAENYNLSVGSNSFIPGFEEQIIGHNTGEEFTITVNFPEDYQAEELAGKESQFKINLHEIKAKELPEVDDEFVQDVSEKETVAEYKEMLKEDVADRLENEAREDEENQIVTKLTELLQAEVPEAMYENKVTDMLREFDMRLRSQGMEMETYLQYMGMDIDALRAAYKPQAEQRVKVRLALEKIAEKEGIVADDTEVEEEYNKLAEQYGMPVEKVKELIAKDDLAKDVAVEKAMEFVKESAIAE
ncbi:MAG TPA: trigger factor [Clostridiales bacterium]|nr:trigger factor [Clostridiales bacterium]